MREFLRDPHTRIYGAWGLLIASLIGWPSTHALMFITDPPENSWVFHVLLAISWIAITVTALDILLTADVRREQENGGGGKCPHCGEAR